MPVPSKPTLLIDPPDTGTGGNAYFDTLCQRPDFHKAFSLRNQAQIDSFPEAAQPSDRQPIIYDPVMDAALLRFFPKVSFDIKGRYLPIEATGSFLLTFDFRFDESFYWMAPGYVSRYKTWNLEPNMWLPIRTDFRAAANNHGKFGEIFFTQPGKLNIVPGQSWRQKDDLSIDYQFEGPIGETLQPLIGNFFFEPNTWTRAFVYVEDLDTAICRLSVWVADETREAVHLYDRVPLYPPGSQMIKTFWIEYDTSGDSNPSSPIDFAQQSWNRNVVVLKGLTLADARELLERPT